MASSQALLLHRTGWRTLALRAWLPSGAFLLAFAAGFVVGTPYALLDFTQFESDVRFEIARLSTGHGIDLGRGWAYHLTRSLPYGPGIPTFAAAIAGIAFTVRRNPHRALVLWTFVAALYGSIGSGQTVFFRYVLPLLPPLCLSAAVAVDDVASWIARHATSAAFVNANGRTPEWMVLHESPIRVPTPAPLVNLGRASYDLVFTVTASTAAAESSVYDRQDAFFMPISGFSSIERPGPTIRVDRRRDAPRLPSTDTASADTSR